MLHKIYIDLETTGLDPVANGVIQIAGYIEPKELKEPVEFNWLIKPFPKDIITDEALKVTGKTRDDLSSYEEPLVVYREFVERLSYFVDKFNPRDKFLFIGYNSRFDMDFLRAWFAKCGDKYFGSWFFFPPIDIMNLAAHTLRYERDRLPDFKLGTVAMHLGLELTDSETLHDAHTDIYLTAQIEDALHKRLGKDYAFLAKESLLTE